MSARVVEPELHVIGEIIGCSLRGMSGGLSQALLSASSTLFGFGGRGENAFAGWEVKSGKEWKCVGGREMGQTQADYPEVSRDSRCAGGPLLCSNAAPALSLSAHASLRLSLAPLQNGHTCVWNHPLDLHFYTSSLAGWPQLVFEVGTLDFYGGKHLRTCFLPFSQLTRDCGGTQTLRPESILAMAVLMPCCCFFSLCSLFSLSLSLSLQLATVSVTFLPPLACTIWKWMCGSPVELHWKN